MALSMNTRWWSLSQLQMRQAPGARDRAYLSIKAPMVSQPERTRKPKGKTFSAATRVSSRADDKFSSKSSENRAGFFVTGNAAGHEKKKKESETCFTSDALAAMIHE